MHLMNMQHGIGNALLMTAAASSATNGVLQSNYSSQGPLLNQLFSQLPQVHTININGQQALFIPTPNATQLTQLIGLQQAVAAAAASVNSTNSSLNVPRTIALPARFIPTAGTINSSTSASIQIPINTRIISNPASINLTSNPFTQLNTTSTNIDNQTIQLNIPTQSPTLQLHCQPSTNGSLSFSFTNNASGQQQQQQQQQQQSQSRNMNVILLNGTNVTTQPIIAATNLLNHETQDFQQMTTAAQLQFPVNQLATQLLQALLEGGGGTQINPSQQQQQQQQTVTTTSLPPSTTMECESTNYNSSKIECDTNKSVINTENNNTLLLDAAKKWLTLGINITNDQRESTTPNDTNKRVIKRSRKSCECPNCIFFKSNVNNPSAITNSLKRTHRCHYSDCGKEYLKTSHLRAHLRSHIGERPYICNWHLCGKSFTRSDELLRHERTHAGEKKFACTQCHKRFLRSDHLRKHSKIHGSDISDLSTTTRNQNILLNTSLLPLPIKVEKFDPILDFTQDTITKMMTQQASVDYCQNNIINENILRSNFSQTDYHLQSDDNNRQQYILSKH